jgi:hypothetical protein
LLRFRPFLQEAEGLNSSLLLMTAGVIPWYEYLNKHRVAFGVLVLSLKALLPVTKIITTTTSKSEEQ